ncbi:MAG: DUF2851 family protein [Candidatus Marinimicrobia bacterium]|nr:DUF2851 family protein [Candidatus Neomarinimicrobiota bacterium]
MGKESLLTTDGEQLIILDTGQRNDGPGPDIFNCHLILDGVEIYGNVEMHLRAKDWYSHKHHLDPKYDRVILHVVNHGSQGPDIPTLQVQPVYEGSGCCLALRPITQSEIINHAFERFKSKINHLNALESNDGGYSPLMLGLFEILLAGSKRRAGLQAVASQLGLSFWPDNKQWQGSNQTFLKTQSIDHLIRAIIHNKHHFEVENWQSGIGESWSSLDPLLTPIQRLGISQNKCREWFVNFVAPHLGESRGFKLWRYLPVFRHYGCEKQLMQNLGLRQINQIVDQQGVLAWDLKLCRPKRCSACPLTQSHQPLTLVN